MEAKSALLIDVATGTILFEQNSHEALAPASVTKVMTMLLIMEAIDSGKIKWNDAVTASAEAAAKGGSQVYLKEGENTIDILLWFFGIDGFSHLSSGKAGVIFSLENN